MTIKLFFDITIAVKKENDNMKIAIVTDTNSGITPEEAKKLDVKVIPMPFLIEGEEFFEDVNLNQEQFYEKLLKGADVSTSQPSIAGVTQVWKDLLKDYDAVLHIPMSSGLSASCETAQSFAKEFGGRVQVVDNKRISVTLKRAVYDAINLIKQGKTAEEIKQILEETGKNSTIYIMLSTLKYLKKGGRITPAAALLGKVLGIKPVLQIQGAKLDKFAQVLSFAQGRKKMIDQIIKDITTRFKDLYENKQLEVEMAYTYDKDKIETFRQEANKALKKYDLQVKEVDPLSLSISCHIGEGAIAIAVNQVIK